MSEVHRTGSEDQCGLVQLENEDPPEREEIVCAHCGGVIPEGEPEYHRAYDRDAFCEDCWPIVAPPDPFDDSDYDRSKE